MSNITKSCSTCRYKDLPPNWACTECLTTQKPRLPHYIPIVDIHPEEEVNNHLEEWKDDNS